MADWPDVTVGIITYNRPDEIKRTVMALVENLRYSGNLKFVIADDSSPGNYISNLKKSRLFKDVKAEFVVTDQNGGWGANANNLLRHTETEYLFMIEDDYVLQRPLDLDVAIALMETRPRIGMVRFRATAGTHLVYHQFEADISEWLPDFLEGEGGYVNGKMTYLLVDSGSPDLFIYSNGPHLKRRLFHTYFGKYPEGLKLGETEEKYAHVVKDGMRDKPNEAPWMAVLPEFIPMRFQHIGVSYQLTDADKAHADDDADVEPEAPIEPVPESAPEPPASEE